MSFQRFMVEWKLKQERKEGHLSKKNRKETETKNMLFRGLIIFPFLYLPICKLNQES